MDDQDDPEGREIFWLAKLSVDYDLCEGEASFTCKVGERFGGDRGGVPASAGSAYCIPEKKSELDNEYTWKSQKVICTVSFAMCD